AQLTGGPVVDYTPGIIGTELAPSPALLFDVGAVQQTLRVSPSRMSSGDPPGIANARDRRTVHPGGAGHSARSISPCRMRIRSHRTPQTPARPARGTTRFSPTCLTSPNRFLTGTTRPTPT